MGSPKNDAAPGARAMGVDDTKTFGAPNTPFGNSDDLPKFAPPAAAGEIGQLGRYRIVKLLGRGGMGAVYLAHDEKMRRQVALKVMLPKVAAIAEARRRFLREARLAAKLNSEYIVSIYEADEVAGFPYIALKYLQGCSLDNEIATKGMLPAAEIVRIGRETALGLAAAHQVGMVHRDIKPSNLWLEAPQGRVKILDLGLAKAIDGTASAELTATGVMIGTPGYMSPEQARGEAVDHRTDIYSLGGVLYRLCTGRLPFQGATSMAMLYSLAMDEATPIRQLNPAIPEPLARLIHQMLAKKPAQRPASALAVAEGLALAIAPEKASAIPMATAAPPGATASATPPPTAMGFRATLADPTTRKLLIGVVLGTAVLTLLTCILVVPQFIFRAAKKDDSVTEIKEKKDAKAELKPDGKSVVAPPPLAKKVEAKQKPLDPTGLPPLRPPSYKPIPIGKSPLDRLDPAAIPSAERFDWQPKELVAVIGQHARRHWRNCNQVNVSPDGKFAASNGADGLMIWDAATQELLATFPPSWSYFSQDSATLYAHQADTNYRIDLTQRPLKRMPVAKVPLTGGMRFDKRVENEATLLIHAKRRATLVDASGAKPVLGGGIDNVAVMQLSPSGVAVYQSDGSKLRMAAVKNAQFVDDRELAIPDGVPRSITDDGKLLALGVKDGAEVWDISADQPRRLHRLKTSANASWFFSPDGRWLASSVNGALWRIDGAEPKLVSLLEPSGSSVVAFSRDGSRAVFGNSRGFVRFWDLAGAEPNELSPLNPALAFDGTPQLDSGPGQVLLQTLMEVPKKSGPRYQTWALDEAAPRPSPAPDAFLDATDRSVVNAGNRLWLGLPGARTYQILNDRWQQQGESLAAPAGTYAVTSDGRVMVGVTRTVGSEYEFSGWDLIKRARIWTVPLGPRFKAGSVILSADQRLCATAFADQAYGGELLLWKNLDTKAELAATIKMQIVQGLGHYFCALSPDGRQLAHLQRDQGEMVLEDLTRTKPIEVAQRGLANDAQPTFSPDGNRLAYASSTGVGVLEAPTLKPLWTWKAPGVVRWCGWAADGRHLLTLNSNHTVYVLRLPEKVVGPSPPKASSATP